MSKWELGFWFATFYGLGLLTAYIAFPDKKKKVEKVETVQPQIEVYGKNYKKINNASKFDRAG